MAAFALQKLPPTYAPLKASITRDTTMSYKSLKGDTHRFITLSPEIFNSPATVNNLAMTAKASISTSALLSRDQCRNCMGHDHWAAECPHPPRVQSANSHWPSAGPRNRAGPARAGP